MANWEYKIETRPMNLEGTETVEQLLNNHGVKGWELVNIIPAYTTSTNDQNQVNNIFVQSYSFVFKREK
ncbi:TPA: DUF4177 domain-containing protein [Bacillus paranthracis]|nr:DUF4177 domain-containing protein [Bacillus paranthracis]